MFGDDGYGEPKPGTGIPELKPKTWKEMISQKSLVPGPDARYVPNRFDFTSNYGDGTGDEMLSRIRQSLQARLEGLNESGDTEVMRLVDALVEQGWQKGHRAATGERDFMDRNTHLRHPR